jgi:hypothetical protein
MQTPREPASHESEADESNLSIEFIEFRAWHDVISLSSGGCAAAGGD